MKIVLYKKLIAATIIGCIFLYGCENKIAEVQQINAKGIGRDESKQVVIRYSVNGKKRSVLTGPLMYRVQDTATYVEFPLKVHVDFFNANDSIESKLDAKYAKYNEGQSKVFLKDSVRVINVLGDTLYCDELYWDRNRTDAEFYTDKPVKIRTRTQTLNGTGMDARQDFSTYHIIHPVGFLKVSNTDFPN
jgi:LPS export ABC transporter protein LptC